MSLSEKVYNGIKQKILSGEYKANTFLSEGMIAETFGVSKSPVRTALHRLCDDGFLIGYARKGYLITNMSTEDYSKLLQVRYAIESVAVLSVMTINKDSEIESLRQIAMLDKPTEPEYSTVNAQFHMTLAKLSNNKFLIKTLSDYLTIALQYYSYTNAFPAPIHETSYHNELIDAMLKRDRELALSWLKKDLGIQINNMFQIVY